MNDDNPQTQQHIILFYRYHPLTSDPVQIEVYRAALEQLCTQLHLCGRILVGASESEGINGTLAGAHGDVRAFTWALLGRDHPAVVWATSQDDNDSCRNRRHAVETFWMSSRDFFQAIGQNDDELRIASPEDFKWRSEERRVGKECWIECWGRWGGGG